MNNVRDYILFIDTETTGLPKKWNLPYSDVDNWPYVVQISWIIYSKEGKFIKSENHYVQDTDYEICPISRKIHGITHEFLKQHGKDRKSIFLKLQNDLNNYAPLLVGHFLQLDYHMMGVGFHRSGLENPANKLPLFCTMKITRGFIRETPEKYLRLNQLYEKLFQKKLEHQHNALIDAKATADCFFALITRGDINEELIYSQKPLNEEKSLINTLGLSLLIVTLLIVVLLVINLWTD